MVVGGGAQVLSTGSSAGSITSKDSSTMDSSGSWSPGFDSRVRSESRSGLDRLAAVTGGSVEVVIGRTTPVLERLQAQMDSTYVLGFQPPGGADNQVHEIDVGVGRSGLRVRHRQSFRARGWDEETGTRLQAALLFGGGPNLHGVAVEARPPAAGGADRARVPITVRFPLTSLSLEPLASEHRGQASIFVTGSGSGRLETAAIRKSVLPIVLANEELSQAVGQMATQLLLGRIAAPDGLPVKAIVVVKLIERASVYRPRDEPVEPLPDLSLASAQ